jgi:hypothetical protein
MVLIAGVTTLQCKLHVLSIIKMGPCNRHMTNGTVAATVAVAQTLAECRLTSPLQTTWPALVRYQPKDEEPGIPSAGMWSWFCVVCVQDEAREREKGGGGKSDYYCSPQSVHTGAYTILTY